MQKTSIQSLGLEDPLEKGMATHPSVLAWRIMTQAINTFHFLSQTEAHRANSRRIPITHSLLSSPCGMRKHQAYM